MTIQQLMSDDGPADSAVQNRLTVAGFVLTTLFFSGSFALSLSAQFQQHVGKDFREEFAYLEVTMVVGGLLAVAAIAGFIACQQLTGNRTSWYNSKRSWFIVATIYLYLSLSQAMSAGFTEIVYGLGVNFGARGLAKVLAAAATMLWLFVLFIAPVHAIHSWWRVLRSGERVLCVVAYAGALAFLLCTNANVYQIQNGSSKSAGAFVENLARQLVQPMMWPDPWDPPK